MLKIGDMLISEISKEKIRIESKLGEGGQGTVYLVKGEQGKLALKWYNSNYATGDQKKCILDLIRQGPPTGDVSDCFIWPKDIVLDKAEGFGYIMDLIDKNRFAELGEVYAHIKPQPHKKELITISKNLARAFKALHLDGFCYRDISDGNFQFDPGTGEILICDNDNVGIQGLTPTSVQGTWEYMAPEIVLDEAEPSAKTDLFSLSVLLFKLWMWHHPFHGMIEYNIRAWDLPAKKLVYGEKPVFIFDENDKSNILPNDPEYNTPRRRWELCPEILKGLFVKAFTVGIRNPNNRVNENEWWNAFVELGDLIIPCPDCRAENIWEKSSDRFNCWYCKKALNKPVRLIISTVHGSRAIVLNKDTKICQRHMDPYSVNERDEKIGEIVQNPADPSIWGIRNTTGGNWIVTNSNGVSTEILPQKSAVITLGNVIDFKNGASATFEY